ncbi:MAG: hypothetical protein GY861_27995 [bacterium]|nr:hypothetical protein [bacterium]
MFGVKDEGQDKSFKWSVTRGTKKGTYLFTFTSTLRTSPRTNDLQIFIEKNKIKTKINFKIYCSTLHHLKIANDSIADAKAHKLVDGSAVNPTEVKITPYDKYNNQFNPICDKNAFSEDRIVNLFGYDHSNGENVTVKVSTDCAKESFSLFVRSRAAGVVKISSRLLDAEYTALFKPGPISSQASFVEVLKKNVKAGDEVHIKIHAHDKYENPIHEEVVKKEAENIFCIAIVTKTKDEIEFGKSRFDKGKLVQFQPLKTAGQSIIKASYKGENLKCNNCNVQIALGDMSWKDSRVARMEDDNQIPVSPKTINNLQKGDYPTWRTFIYDKFKNQYTKIPANLLFTATLVGPKITVNLCTEVVNNYVETVVCPDAKSQNVWKYLISKKGYELRLYKSYTDKKKLPEMIKFPMAIVGGKGNEDASNGDMDINQTWFSKKEIKSKAGEVFTFQIEIRTNEGKRKNYWFLDTKKQMIVLFGKNPQAKHYKFEIIKGAKPGQYVVKVSSTMAYSINDQNTLTMGIDGRLCPTKLKYIVDPDVAVRGELRNDNMEVMKKIPEGNADVSTKFNLVLFDKYENHAICEPEELNVETKDPSGKKKTTNITKNADGYSCRLRAYTRIAGNWSWSCDLVNDDKPIVFPIYPGRICNNHSRLNAPKDATAGKGFKVHLVPFDCYGNYIDMRTQGDNPFAFMHKFETRPGKYSNYISYKTEPELVFQKPKTKFRNFNNVEAGVRGFKFIEGKNYEVNIVSKASKCLKVTKDSSCLKSLALNHSYGAWYTLMDTSNKQCLQETRLGYVYVKCNPKALNQHFRIVQNFDSTIAIFVRSNGFSLTVNFAGILTKFRPRGGKNQRFQCSTVQPQKSPFSGDGKEGEIAVLEYKISVTRATDYVFRATVDGKECKVVNAMTTVNPDKPHFESFLIQRFSSCKAFEEMADEFSEDNTKVDPIYRAYPRDQYKNLIDEVVKDDWNVTFVDEKKNVYKLNVNVRNEKKFVEFIKNDDKKFNVNLYENLVKGNYSFNIANKRYGEKVLTKKVLLHGLLSDKGADNHPLDIQKTVIRESKLKLVAGQWGYIIFKLRTTSGARRNEWGHKITVSSSLNDNFEFKARNAGVKGSYYVKVKTDKANNFPSDIKNSLAVSINGVLVKNLSAELDVSPAEIDDCEVMEENRQDEKTIRSGNADIPLSFKVRCQDKFDNYCLAACDKIDLDVLDSNKKEIKTETSIERTSGIATFTARTREAGDYTIKGDSKIFKQVYTYTNESGALVTKNTVLTPKFKSIVAGETAELEVIARDQWKNEIFADDVKERFNVHCKTPDDKIIKSAPDTEGNKMTFSALLTRAGITDWIINCDKKGIACKGCEINVAAAQPDLKNTYFSTSNLATDDPKGTVTKTNKYLTTAKAYLHDQYFNRITDIDTKKYSLSDVNLSGHNTEPIKFYHLVSSSLEYFDIEVKDYLSIRRYSRLVKNKGYDFKCNINGPGEKKEFQYKINIRSCRDDTGRGNGNYVAEKTDVSIGKLSFEAGDEAALDVTLKTSEDKIFNDGVNTAETFKYKLKYEDKNFKFSIKKKGYASGIYSLAVSTTSIFAFDQELTLSVKEMEGKKWVELKEKITILVLPKLPPNTRSTKWISKPASKHPAAKDVVFKFQAFDMFNNPIYDPGCSSYFILKNYDSTIKSNTVLDKDNKTFILTANIEYPPRLARLQIIYKDNEGEAEMNNEAFDVEFVSKTAYDNSKVRGSNLQQMAAGESLDLNIYLFDVKKVCVDTNKKIDMKVTVTGPLKTKHEKRINYDVKLVKSPAKECINSYKAVVGVNGRYILTGDYKIQVFINGKHFKDISQRVVSGPIDSSKFVITNTSHKVDYKKLPAGTKFCHDIKARDSFGNHVTTQLSDEVEVEFVPKDKGSKLESDDFSIDINEKVAGIMNVCATLNQVGSYYMALLHKDKVVSGLDRSAAPATYEVQPLECAGKHTKYDTSLISKPFVGDELSLTFGCFDKFGNKLVKGGSKVTATVALENDKNCKSKLSDKGDGDFTVKFTPEIPSTYKIIINIGDDVYGEEALEFKIDNKPCEGDTPVRCPAKPSVCVAQIKDCLGKNNCPNETPFMVMVNHEENCMASQTDADCSKEHVKCSHQPICVTEKEKKEKCVEINYKGVKKSNDKFLCLDGNNQVNANQCPNQHTCPVGLTLCPNLSCALSLAKCAQYPACPANMVRCHDQTCASEYSKCPSSVVCSNEDDIVCPDGTCKGSELECGVVDLCDDENVVICPDGSCVDDIKNCLKGKICGVGKALCSDEKCKEICNSHKVEKKRETADEIAKRIQPSYEYEKIMEEQQRVLNLKIKKEEREKLEELAEEEKIMADEKEDKKIEEERKALEEKKIKEEVERAKKIKDKNEKKRREEEIKKKKAKEEARKRAAEEARERKKRQQQDRARKIAEAKKKARILANRNWMSIHIHPRVPFYTAKGINVKCGQRLKFIHWNLKNALHSHHNRYNTGSRKQEVTSFWHRDDNDWFIIDCNDKLKSGSIIQIRHFLTNKTIFCDSRHRAPTSGQRECHAEKKSNSNYSNWKLEILNNYNGNGYLSIGDMVRFINVETKYSLHSHGLRNRVTRQWEVTCFHRRDSNDNWILVQAQ